MQRKQSKKNNDAQLFAVLWGGAARRGDISVPSVVNPVHTEKFGTGLAEHIFFLENGYPSL